MLRNGFLIAFFVVLAFGADNPPNTTTEAVVAHDEDIIPLHASIRETTLIVLPAAEKAMGLESLVALVATTGNFSMTCMTAATFGIEPPADNPTPLAG